VPAPARCAFAAYLGRFADPADTRPLTLAWAPGRVNLIGEHTDYNDGLVLPAAIDRVVALAGRAAPPSASSPVTRLYSAYHDEVITFAADRAALAGSPAELPIWAKYPRSVLSQLAELADVPLTSAFDAAIAGDVPLGGGMSSSAAFEVATATFAAALGGPALSPMDTALLCQRAEHQGVGVRVGILDQAASCLGRAGHAILLDCRSLDYEYVPVALPEIVLALYDTGVPHTLAESGYNERRRQCEEAVAIFAWRFNLEEPSRPIRSLRDLTLDDLDLFGGLLAADWAVTIPLPDREALVRRVRHVLTENERVLHAARALEAGDAEALGALLYASHASLRDDYEVSCPELDAVVEIARETPGALGARMMGAGFGGSALILTRRDALPTLEATLARDYPLRTGRTGALQVCEIASGPARALVAMPLRA